MEEHIKEAANNNNEKNKKIYMYMHNKTIPRPDIGR